MLRCLVLLLVSCALGFAQKRPFDVNALMELQELLMQGCWKENSVAISLYNDQVLMVLVLIQLCKYLMAFLMKG